MSELSVKVGDWVSYMSQSMLIIGEVMYIHGRKSWDRSDTLFTTVGRVQLEDILEVREAKP